MVNTADISPGARAAYARFVKRSGRSHTITSGYRSPEYNAKVGGAKNSQHLHGSAYDISTAGMSEHEVKQLVRHAVAAGFSGIGVYDNSLHFDTGPSRYWGPSYSADSAPPWLPEIMGQGAGQHAGEGAEHDHGSDPHHAAAKPLAPAYQRLSQAEDGSWVGPDGNPMHQGLTRIGNHGISTAGLAGALDAFGNYARGIG